MEEFFTSSYFYNDIGNPQQYDVIMAVDFLNHIGDLEKVFSLSALSLSPGGLFAFTIDIFDELQDVDQYEKKNGNEPNQQEHEQEHVDEGIIKNEVKRKRVKENKKRRKQHKNKQKTRSSQYQDMKNSLDDNDKNKEVFFLHPLSNTFVYDLKYLHQLIEKFGFIVLHLQVVDTPASIISTTYQEVVKSYYSQDNPDGQTVKNKNSQVKEMSSIYSYMFILQIEEEAK